MRKLWISSNTNFFLDNNGADTNNSNIANNTLDNPCYDRRKYSNSYTHLTKHISNSNIFEGRKDLFNCIIIKNIYVDACFENTKKDKNSFYSLIERDLSQSDAIKLGIAVERIFKDIILSNRDLQDIRPTNTKGESEKDHLFYNKKLKTVYYAEVKGNLTLDTEKKRATIQKINAITTKLQSKYNKKIKVKSFLFAPRYYITSDIPDQSIKSYITLNAKVVGVNDYLQELGVDYQFEDEVHYKKMLNFLAHRMFECFNSSEINQIELAKTALGESIIPDRPEKIKHKSYVYNTNGNLLSTNNTDIPPKSFIFWSKIKLHQLVT